jgi:hypothetical protein
MILGPIIRDSIMGGASMEQCHQISQGGVSGSAKVSRDIFPKKWTHFGVLASKKLL